MHTATKIEAAHRIKFIRELLEAVSVELSSIICADDPAEMLRVKARDDIHQASRKMSHILYRLEK